MRAERIAPLSIQARLTIWYCVVLLVVLTACGLGLYGFQYRLGLARVDVDLQRAVDLMADTLVADLTEEDAEEEADAWSVIVREAIEDLPFPGRTVAILDETDQPLATREAALDVSRILRFGFTQPTHTVATETGDWRVLSRRITHPDVTFRVLMAESLAPLGDDLDDLRRILFVGIPLALLLAASAGWTVARRGLVPLTRLASEVRAMHDDPADRRLTDPGTRDELATLTEEFNGLLARLDLVLRGQRQFMADASHELRTPVSVIRNAADVTLSQPARSVVEYTDSLRVVGEQASRLTRIVDDMFLLARSDAGGRQLQSTRFYLDELVDECLRAIGLLATSQEIGVEANVTRDIEIEGDEDLVRQMVMNVLDNAVRHTAPGGAMRVSLTRQGASAEIEVYNDGDGIPAEDGDRIFDRFVRLDAARSPSDHGGLGLPIARWIAEAHAGSLSLVPGDTGGVTFVVRVPLPWAASGPRPSVEPPGR